MEFKPSFMRAIYDAQRAVDIEDFESLRASYNRKSTLVLDPTGLRPYAPNSEQTMDNSRQMRMLTQEYVLFFYVDVKKVNPNLQESCIRFQEKCEKFFLHPLRAYLTKGDTLLENVFDARMASLKKAIDQLDYYVDDDAMRLCLQETLSPPDVDVGIPRQHKNLPNSKFDDLEQKTLDGILDEDQLKQQTLVTQYCVHVYLNERERNTTLDKIPTIFAQYHKELNRKKDEHQLDDVPFDVRKRYDWQLGSEIKKVSHDLNALIEKFLKYQKHRDRALELSESLSFLSVRQKSQDWKRMEQVVVPWLPDHAVYRHIKSNYWFYLPLNYVPPDPDEYVAMIALGAFTEEPELVDRLYPETEARNHLSVVQLLQSRVFIQMRRLTPSPTFLEKYIETMMVSPEYDNQMKSLYNEAPYLAGSLSIPVRNRLNHLHIPGDPSKRSIKQKMSIHPTADPILLEAFTLGYYALLTNGQALRSPEAMEISRKVHSFLEERTKSPEHEKTVPKVQLENLSMIQRHFAFLNPLAMKAFRRQAVLVLLNEWLQMPWRKSLLDYTRPIVSALHRYDDEFVLRSRNDTLDRSKASSSRLQDFNVDMSIAVDLSGWWWTIGVRGIARGYDPGVMSHKGAKSTNDEAGDVGGKKRLSTATNRRKKKQKTNVPNLATEESDERTLHNSILQESDNDDVTLPTGREEKKSSSKLDDEQDISDDAAVHVYDTPRRAATPSRKRSRSRSASPEPRGVPFLRLPDRDSHSVLAHMYPGRDEGIRRGQALLEYRQYYFSGRTRVQMEEDRLRQTTADLQGLREDPNYAEKHETVFPEINARVRGERIARAQAEVDREERERTRREYLNAVEARQVLRDRQAGVYFYF